MGSEPKIIVLLESNCTAQTNRLKFAMFHYTTLPATSNALILNYEIAAPSES